MQNLFVTFVSKSNTKLPYRAQFLKTVDDQAVQSPAELPLTSFVNLLQSGEGSNNPRFC
jgi:hypothetical protein